MRNPHFLNATGSTQSQCMQTLKEMHKLFKHEKFHESKMMLWEWLQNRTDNGRTYYGIGKQCSLEAILPSIRNKLTEIESKFLTINIKTSKICLNQADHQHPTKEISKATFKVVEENFLPEDRLFISNSTSPINLTKNFQRYAATKGITWTSASCSKVIKDLISDEDLVECVRCDSPATCNSQITSLPDIIVLEIVKKNDGPLVRGNTYKLVGIIYYSRARSHYWSDVFVQGTSSRNFFKELKNRMV